MKIAIFIPYRLRSSRLNNKPLIKIKSKPVAEHLINRIKQAKLPQQIVLCTTTNKEDEALVKLAVKNNIGYFRGDEKDLLKRYLGAAEKFKVNFIVNVDGDDLFCEPYYMDKIIEHFKKTNADYIIFEDLPFGVTPLGVKVEALRKVCESKKTNDTQTGWGSFFTKDSRFKIEKLKPKKEHIMKDLRMTFDYPEDLEFFKTVFDYLYKKDSFFNLDDIIKLVKEKPEIKKINSHLQEIYFHNFNKEIAKREKIENK